VNITPGTLVLFTPHRDDQAGGSWPSLSEIVVNGGTLTAVGTSSNQILFSSAAAAPAPGDFGGLEYYSGSLTLEQAVIEYGLNGLTVADGGTNTFADCTISNCLQNGGVAPVSELPVARQRAMRAECPQQHNVGFPEWRVGDE
jgi:hypothetical protein